MAAREEPPLLESGVVRQGAITEIVGKLSSGRTSLLIAVLARHTRAGAVAALVDVDHAFDPATAGRSGVDLRRLLWIRCGGRRDLALRAVDLLVRCPGFGLVALDVGETVPRLPLAAAFRLRLAVRRRDIALLVLGRRRLMGSAASLVVETVQDAVQWTGASRSVTRLAGMGTRMRVLRDQGGLPPASAPGTHWWWVA